MLSEERRYEAVEYCEGGYSDASDAGRCRPRLVFHLERQEARRIEHERDVPEEALGHRVDREYVRRVLAEVKDLRRPGVAESVRCGREVVSGEC